MKIATVYSSKGGVGKTTSAVAIAAGMALLRRTLLIDFDPQGQVGMHFGLPLTSEIYHWLKGDKPIEQCVVAGRPEQLLLLLGDRKSKTAQDWFRHRVEGLAEKIRQLPSELLVIDTGGVGDVLQEAALMVSDVVVIPFWPEGGAVDGVHNSLELVGELAPNAQTIFLPVAYLPRWNVHREALQSLQQDFPTHPELDEKYAIPARVAVKQGVPLGQTVWELKESGILDARVAYTYLIERILTYLGQD